MTKMIGRLLVCVGACCWLSAGADALTCIRQPIQQPARCQPGGETPLTENGAFPNCVSSGAQCIADEGSVCGSFNGFGHPRHGICIYYLGGSTVLRCREQTSKGKVTLHYWVGGCAWDEHSQCSCVFEVKEDIDPVETEICNCSQFQ